MAGKPRLTPEEALRRRRERSLRWYYENRERAVASALAWNKANPEKKREHDRAYHARHKEERAAKHREWAARVGYSSAPSVRKWRSLNPEKARAADRARYERDREAYYAYQRAYAKAHPEMVRVRVRRRKARLRGAIGSFTVSQWLEKCARLGHLCLYCGKPKPLTIDHVVPVSRGGTNFIDNIVPACESCNKTKRDKTAEEFMEWRRRRPPAAHSP